ncbi:MAG TPA: arginine--tRNA ligase [Actinomycetota bacterium]|nr:arginine--tRNA ligase [Actinomycetota bacterium]
MIEERLTTVLREAADEASAVLGDAPPPERIELTRPPNREFGDFSTNLALVWASRLGAKPRDVAQAVIDHLPGDPLIEKAEVAGPGFVNLFVRPTWLHDAIRAAAALGDAYGRAEPNGKRVQVEFVSANPTGPLTIGHARNAAIGDTLARMFEATGWGVEREYYFNDAGGQMDRFGASVEARYLALVGREAEVPDDGYHGDYVTDIAREILENHGPGLAELEDTERFERMREYGAGIAMGSIRRTLARFGVEMDTYLHEATLSEKGEIDQAIERLRASGDAYDKDDAVWFRSTAYGDDKDRVVIRSNGIHTYFGADCAYLIDKFSRGFDHLVYVWGADHHGDVARVKGAAKALGFDPDAAEILIYQFVSFLRGGVPVKMSKRAGAFVSLDDLIDAVGTDAARYHLLMFGPDSAMNFDIDEVARQTMENPVYYVQYAHARIASIMRRAAERGVALGPVDDARLELLEDESEIALMRRVAELPGELADATRGRAPQRLTRYAEELAQLFHRFYGERLPDGTHARLVVGDDPELTQARLWLSRVTKQSIAIVLGLLGVAAPEHMERTDTTDDDV